MGGLEQRLETDVLAATRARTPELGTLRLLRAALQNERIAKRVKDLPEADVVAVFRRELKRRQEAALMYEQGARAELAQKEQAEAGVIKRYLPASPSPADVRSVAVKLQQELGLTGPSAQGQLIKAVVAHFQGAADGQTVSGCVRELLSKT